MDTLMTSSGMTEPDVASSDRTLALDMTTFATYIDSTNAKAPIAQRGKAKQKRSDLRLVGLGLVVTCDGGVPLVSHVYPGNRPDVTHSPTLHQAQSRGFDQTLAKASAKLSELAEVLARGNTRRPRAKVETEIGQITRDPWVTRVIIWDLTGDTPPEHRLAFHVDEQTSTALEEEVFGKHVLITDREDWPVTEVIAGYRSQSEAEFGFRQLKDPPVVSFSPMHHWTDHTIRVHLFTCVLALQIAHLMRRHAAQHDLSRNPASLQWRQLPEVAVVEG